MFCECVCVCVSVCREGTDIVLVMGNVRKHSSRLSEVFAEMQNSNVIFVKRDSALEKIKGGNRQARAAFVGFLRRLLV